MLWLATVVIAVAIFFLVPGVPRAAARKTIPPAREDYEDEN